MRRLLSFLLLVCTPLTAGPVEDARGLVEAGKLDEAKALLVRALDADETRAPALVVLTEICNRTESYEDGVDYGKQAVKLLPESSEAHYQYAIALRIRMMHVSKLKAMFSLGAYKKALIRAIELDPANVAARVEQIEFLASAPGVAGGDKDEARRRITELEQYDWAMARRMAAGLEIADGKPQRAIEIYEEIVARYPDDLSSRYRLALLMQQQRRFEEADGLLTALAASEERWYALTARYQLARSRILGTFEQERAIELLEAYIAEPTDGLENLPSKADAYWRIGMAYEQLGRTDDARAAYRSALELDPEHERAAKALEALGS